MGKFDNNIDRAKAQAIISELKATKSNWGYPNLRLRKWDT